VLVVFPPCSVDDEPQLEGKYRVLCIKFQTNSGLPPENPVLPLGVVILKTSCTDSGVVFDVQYDATLIQPRTVLDIFVPLGGSFLPPPRPTMQATQDITSLLRRTLISAVLSIPVAVFPWAPLQPCPIIYGSQSRIQHAILRNADAIVDANHPRISHFGIFTPTRDIGPR